MEDLQRALSPRKRLFHAALALSPFVLGTYYVPLALMEAVLALLFHASFDGELELLEEGP